jgi:tRNA(Ile)-lysidine synthetase-like protein
MIERRAAVPRNESERPEPVLVGKIAETIAKHRLIETKDLVLVAVSGGPDSTALLVALHTLGYRVHAAHLNHLLREEARGDAKFVEALCRERGIPVTLGEVDVAAARATDGGGVQEVARALRYEFLERIADEAGAMAIATAHTRDDRAETVMLNIVRGSGPDGLRGIPYRRGRIVRPLLDASRAEIEAYCDAQGIEPRRDASNESNKYARNEVRNVLFPYLRDRFNANVTDALLRLSDIASAEGELLEEIAAKWLGGAKQLFVLELARQPVAIQRRIVRLWLRTVCGVAEASMARIDEIVGQMPMPFHAMLPGAVWIGCDGHYIRSLDENRTTVEWGDLDVAIGVPGEAVFCGWHVSASGAAPSGTAPAVRFFRRGDRMPFPYGRKKVSELFRVAKTPTRERWTTPLLVDTVTGNVIAIANGPVSPLANGITFTAARAEKQQSDG